jgi:hypothetical protein
MNRHLDGSPASRWEATDELNHIDDPDSIDAEPYTIKTRLALAID